MRPSTLEAYDGPEAYGEGTVSEDLYPKATREMVELRHKLAPATDDAFRTFNERVFEDGTGSRPSSSRPTPTSSPRCATSSGCTWPRRIARWSCASTRSRMCGWPPARKGDVERLLQRVACGHVSGLMRGRQGPQAPMGSADRDLNRSSGLRPSTSPGFPRSVGATDHSITLLPLQASARRPRLTPRPRFCRWSAAPSAPRRSAPSCWPTRPPPRAGGAWRAAPGSRDWPWSPWSTTAPTARR